MKLENFKKKLFPSGESTNTILNRPLIFSLSKIGVFFLLFQKSCQYYVKKILILKNIITPDDWKIMREHIQYDFLYDNHFSELKDAELMTERLNMAATAEPYIGKYYSQDYVRRKILRQTDEEILEQDILIEKEIKSGKIPDPNAPIDPNTGMPMVTGDSSNGSSGKVPMDPGVDEKGMEPPTEKGI